MFLKHLTFYLDKKGCTRLAAASDKVYQLLVNGRWFSPGSSTTKTGRHDIAEILLKVELKHQKSNNYLNDIFSKDSRLGTSKSNKLELPCLPFRTQKDINS